MLQCVFQCVKTVAGYKDCDEYVCNYPVHALERYLHELSCVACSVLQCVAVCCRTMQSMVQCVALERHFYELMRVAVCCSMLQCVAVCCSVLQRVAACCSVLQCVAVCVAVCCSRVSLL